MARLSAWVGIVLIGLGVWGYRASDGVSVTALIPAAFGFVILVLGVLGRSDARRRTMMHIAMGVALVGIAGSSSGLMKFASAGMAAGLAVRAKAAMAGVLIVYLALGVRSFIAARRK